MQLKDEELVAKYTESHNYAYLTELFTRHSRILYQCAFRITKNAPDTEDILQTAYMKMISSLPDFKGMGSVVGWMRQVVIRTCYEKLRSEKSRSSREKKFMSERIQITRPKNDELTETVEMHLNQLPEIYKAPIRLKIMQGLSVKEVSDTLKVPEKTIRSQISRGLEKLKESLQGVGGYSVGAI